MIARTRPAPGRQGAPERSQSQTRIEHAGLTWIDIVGPTAEDVAYLREHHSFHPLALEDVLSRIQRPKLDTYEEQEYLFLVLHFPVFDKANRIANPSELDIFVGRNYLITLHDGGLKPLRRLVLAAANEPQVRSVLMERGSGYLLYRIIDALVKSCFPMINRVDEHIDRIEAGIFEQNVRPLVQDLSFVRRDIIALRRIVKPNIPVVRSLELRERDFLRVDEEAYFGDVTDSLARLWDMLEEQRDIIEGLNATIDSLTSHRINDTMKTLTLISVLLLPMTLVASILGMNVMLPFAEHPLALPAAILVMLLLAGGMIVYFRVRGLM